MRRGRRHLHLPDASRRGRLPRGALPPRREGRRGALSADRQGGSPPQATARRARGGHRLVSGGPAPGPAGREGARLPRRARPHPRDTGALRDRLCADQLGRADASAHRTWLHQRRADLLRARFGIQPGRRDRQIPGPDHHPHPRRVGPRGGPRRADHARRRGAQVPQLAGRPALRQEPHPVRPRPRQGGHPAREADRHRGGLHRCDGGPPGRLRQRGRQPRHGADRGAGGAGDAIRR